MKLTGKAKEKFAIWFTKWYNPTEKGYSLETFYVLPESMQWGVIQDWADSMGYILGLVVDISSFNWRGVAYSLDKSPNYTTWKKTRQEARNAAIEKLNEIINKQ